MLALGAPAAFAQAAPTPAASCTEKSAQATQINKMAQDPAAYAGKCVKLKGYWRDIGFYPTAGEANQPDALSVIFLDQRRIGLYLSDADLKRAPHGPVAATAFGTAGDCASLGKPGDDKVPGYCHYKGGAFLAVAGIEAAK
jgi:hypothetical protein